MKTLFRLALVAIAVFIGVSANAQDKPLTFGVEAGMNLSNFTGDLKEDAKIGFNVGVTLDYALAQDFYLMTGLKYSLEGTKVGGIDGKINFSYLKLPIHFGYKMAISESAKIVLHIGPHIAYAVDGKYKVGSVSVDAFASELENEQGFNYNRFDFGLGLGVAAEFNKICVGLGYDLGLINLVNMKDSSWSEENTGIADPKGKNMNAYLTLGYKF